MSKGTFVYLGGFELPDRNAAAHRVLANAKILRRLGYNTVIVGIRKSDEPGLTRYETDFHGFECWSVPYPIGYTGWLKYLAGLASILRFISGRDGISGVICYNYPALAQIRIFRLCRRLGIKRIADATEWYDASAGNPVFRVVKALDTWLRMRVANEMSDGIMTTSCYVTNLYKTRGKTTVELPTLFDTKDIPAPPVATGPRRRSFIYVGYPFFEERVNKRRSNLKERLDECVRLFHELHADGHVFEFDIYGIGAEEYLRVFPEHTGWLRAMAGEVRFHGKIPNTTVRERIATSDFSIFFRDETRLTLAGFPTKLAESISFGAPVLSSRNQNVEGYASSDGIFLAAKGEERAVLETVLNLSDFEVNELKAKCFSSRIFDYRAFERPFGSFLTSLGLQ